MAATNSSGKHVNHRIYIDYIFFDMTNHEIKKKLHWFTKQVKIEIIPLLIAENFSFHLLTSLS